MKILILFRLTDLGSVVASGNNNSGTNNNNGMNQSVKEPSQTKVIF